MHSAIALWIGGAIFVVGLAALIIAARRHRPHDLGSVSTAWTTEHSVGYRGGDGSTH